MVAHLLKQGGMWVLLTCAIALAVGSWRALPAHAAPSDNYEARQAKALESIAASLKKLENRKCN
jgi:hypothetical protein